MSNSKSFTIMVALATFFMVGCSQKQVDRGDGLGGAIASEKSGEALPQAASKDIRLSPEELAKLEQFNRYLNLASDALARQDNAGALVEINRALEMRPNHPFALQIRSIVYEQKGSPRLALQDALEIILGEGKEDTNISTDAAFVARAMLLAEQLGDQQKLAEILVAAQKPISQTRTNDGMPKLDPQLSTRDALLIVAVKDSLFHGDTDVASKFLEKVSDRTSSLVRFYGATIERDSGRGETARETFRELSESPSVDPGLREIAKRRLH
jgi:hypothetical protein